MFSKILTFVSLLLIFFLCVGSDCKKSTEPKGPYYEGICRTDTAGNIIEDDTTDWQPRIDSMLPTDLLGVSPPFPNPCSDQITFVYYLATNMKVEIEVYSKPDKLEVILLSSYQSGGNHQYIWDLKDASGNYLENGIYRVYIKATTYTGKEYESYGDIQIERCTPLK